MNRVQNKCFQLKLQHVGFRIRGIPSADLGIRVRFKLRFHLNLEFLETVAFYRSLTAFSELNLLSKAKNLKEKRIQLQSARLFRSTLHVTYITHSRNDVHEFTPKSLPGLNAMSMCHLTYLRRKLGRVNASCRSSFLTCTKTIDQQLLESVFHLVGKITKPYLTIKQDMGDKDLNSIHGLYPKQTLVCSTRYDIPLMYSFFPVRSLRSKAILTIFNLITKALPGKEVAPISSQTKNKDSGNSKPMTATMEKDIHCAKSA